MLFTRKSRTLLGAVCLAAGATFAVQASAQDGTAESQQAAPSIQAPEAGETAFSDQKLKSFAVAFLEVDKITKQYMPKLQEAQSAEEQQQVRNEAGAEMVKAVEQSDGISINEYNQIVQSAQTDPELANKLSRYIREAGGSAGE